MLHPKKITNTCLEDEVVNILSVPNSLDHILVPAEPFQEGAMDLHFCTQKSFCSLLCFRIGHSHCQPLDIM